MRSICQVVPFWIVAIVGSMGAAVLLTAAGVLFWLARRAVSRKPQRQ